MSLNRREMLRLGAAGAGGLILSSAAVSQVLPGLVAPNGSGAVTPNPSTPAATPALVPAQPVAVPAGPAGIDPQLFARAKAAMNSHQVGPRDSIGIVDFSKPSSEPRFYIVD